MIFLWRVNMLKLEEIQLEIKEAMRIILKLQLG